MATLRRTLLSRCALFRLSHRHLAPVTVEQPLEMSSVLFSLPFRLSRRSQSQSRPLHVRQISFHNGTIHRSSHNHLYHHHHHHQDICRYHSFVRSTTNANNTTTTAANNTASLCCSSLTVISPNVASAARQGNVSGILAAAGAAAAASGVYAWWTSRDSLSKSDGTSSRRNAFGILGGSGSSNSDSGRSSDGHRLPLSVRKDILAGRKCAAEGDNMGAERHYERALALLEHEMPEDEAVCVCLDAIGNAALRRGDLAKAERYLKRVPRLLVVSGGLRTDSREVIEVSAKLAGCYHGMGSTELAAAGYLWCARTAVERLPFVARPSSGASSVSIAAAIDQLNSLLGGGGGAKKKEPLGQPSVTPEALEDDDLALAGICLDHLAHLSAGQGDFRGCLVAFEASLCLARALRSRHVADDRIKDGALVITKALASVTVAAEAAGDLDRAIEAAREAQDIAHGSQLPYAHVHTANLASVLSAPGLKGTAYGEEARKEAISHYANALQAAHTAGDTAAVAEIEAIMAQRGITLATAAVEGSG